VCPLRGRHEHAWAPTPPAAFVDVDGAWRDTRAITTFTGPHALGRARCPIPSWHQHAVFVDDEARRHEDARERE
jgi:hypothetical protein